MGRGASPDLSKDRLEKAFPRLGGSGYEVTSDPTPAYNCVAWAAARDQRRWWEPSTEVRHYWPAGVPRDYSMDAFVELFRAHGFEVGELDLSIDPAVEKVVLYADQDGDFAHAAFQTDAGRWASKLGKWEDIEHDRPEDIMCEDYGPPQVLLCRHRRAP